MPLEVFISSKMVEFRDLRDMLRHHLKERGIDAWIYEEDASARPETVIETSLKEVEMADVFVGLFWNKYGEVTVKEYRRARDLGKPCFIYVRDKNLPREKNLQEFLKAEIYDLNQGVSYAFFDSAVALCEQVAKDIMAWLVWQYREKTAEIENAPVSQDEIDRLKAEVERLQSVSREPLPKGTFADYFRQQVRFWLLGRRLQFLTEEDRELSVLRYVYGLSQAEIAKRWGVTPQAVNNRCKKLEKRLMAILDIEPRMK